VPNNLLLRFRNLTADIDTVEAHNEVARREKSVYWGWWKKPPEMMPDPALTELAREVTSDPGTKAVFFVDSANNDLYRAQLYEVAYEPGGPEKPAPKPKLCPTYYRSKKLPAWFRVGAIEKVNASLLNEYVFSASNRTAFSRAVSGLSKKHIGQIVSDSNFLDSNVSLWFIENTGDIEFVERTQVVRPLSRGVWPAKGHLALHISDLHFGEHHGFRNELASSREPRLAKESVAEALIQDLEAMSLRFDEIALVLISGDLSWSGDAHEFANAASFVGKLRNAFGLHISQIVVVPGNHDIEWRTGKGDIDPNAELNYSTFCSNLYQSEPEESLLRIHQFTVDGRLVQVIGLNSCRIESKENAGLGFVGRDQLNEALRFLKSANKPADYVRIALMHHHLLPVNYVEGVDSETKRVSLTLDAEAVMRSLISSNVRLLLHGHQHQPYVAEIRRVIQGFVDPIGVTDNDADKAASCLDGKLTIVGGGSIGVDREHLNALGRNSYNIIDLSRNKNLFLRVRVQSPVGPGFSDYQSFACPLKP
jgi:predicted MPP superfamily phosphohydrolase